MEAILELRRTIWVFVDPFRWQTDLGDTLVLPRTSPRAVELQLGATYGRRLERDLAMRCSVTSDLGIFLLRDVRLAHEPVAQAIEIHRVGKNWSRWQWVARALISNTVWTRARFVSPGLLDPTCQLCHKRPRHGVAPPVGV